jgi:hypothetical protein
VANSQGLTYSFLLGLLNGKHAFGTTVVRATTAPDDFKGALYSSSGSIDPTTTAYTSTDEVTGTGYSAGGVSITFGTAPSLDGSSAIVTPSVSLTFAGVTLANFDCLMIYNDTLPGKDSVGTYTFGNQTVVASDFVLTMPANIAGAALIELFA